VEAQAVSTRYDKANSIVEIRGRHGDHASIVARIRRLHEHLSPAADDYRTRIVRRACNDLLGELTLEPGPRLQLREHVVQELERLPDEYLERYLFYRYRYEIFPLTQQLDDFPPNLMIEPTSICNYRCVFCFQSNREFTDPKNGHMGLMSFELFQRIVDQAVGRVEAVNLSSRGEPFLNKDIERMLGYVRGKFLGLKINTNASMLTERYVHAILQSGANTIVFSADAAAEPLYGQLRVRGKLPRVLANLEMFQRIRETQYVGLPLITRVSGVRYAKEQDIDEMERFWGRLVDQVCFVDYAPHKETYEADANGITAPCSELWRRMYVWWDGRVNPCEVDYFTTLRVGDAREEALSDVWTGVRFSELRRKHLEKRRHEQSPCRGCTFV